MKSKITGIMMTVFLTLSVAVSVSLLGAPASYAQSSTAEEILVIDPYVPTPTHVRVEELIIPSGIELRDALKYASWWGSNLDDMHQNQPPFKKYFTKVKLYFRHTGPQAAFYFLTEALTADLRDEGWGEFKKKPFKLGAEDLKWGTTNHGEVVHRTRWTPSDARCTQDPRRTPLLLVQELTLKKGGKIDDAIAKAKAWVTTLRETGAYHKVRLLERITNSQLTVHLLLEPKNWGCINGGWRVFFERHGAEVFGQPFLWETHSDNLLIDAEALKVREASPTSPEAPSEGVTSIGSDNHVRIQELIIDPGVIPGIALGISRQWVGDLLGTGEFTHVTHYFHHTGPRFAIYFLTEAASAANLKNGWDKFLATNPMIPHHPDPPNWGTKNQGKVDYGLSQTGNDPPCAPPLEHRVPYLLVQALTLPMKGDQNAATEQARDWVTTLAGTHAYERVRLLKGVENSQLTAHLLIEPYGWACFEAGWEGFFEKQEANLFDKDFLWETHSDNLLVNPPPLGDLRPDGDTSPQ